MMKTKELERIYFSTTLLPKSKKLIRPLGLSPAPSDYWKKPKVISQTYLLEFPETILLSRVLFFNPSAINFTMKIGIEQNGEYVEVARNIQCTKKAMKSVWVGFIPCKFIKIITNNEEPFFKPSDIKCYGMKGEFVQERYGDDMIGILYNNTVDIVYD